MTDIQHIIREVLSFPITRPYEAQTSSRKQVVCKRFLLLAVVYASIALSALATCTAPKNAIEGENCLLGSPSSNWYVYGAGSPNIQGFATDMSVNVGQTIFFKIQTNASAYRIDIYRMGYYQGQGARLIASILPSATLPDRQFDRSNRLW